ncbi:hypothetical protein CG477_016730 [Bacillus cytotoxicus]|uniref:hypothetical protein n=1 Tax=unclassified Bacillus cereus group TaxID=2750818 RepID=UPI000B97AA75|nr:MULTISPECIES: hypothetical protein [unclassified Bacillus cereus group]AWC45811.1 hypothetical protein CG479_015720 [Bacillus cytotoxicus]AWC53911.1 hypothetical protein CG477_016730 [Bacillus cytotoxicus]AWC58038.1 hypothetical protein CG476_016755 [Bacillus cytotoxicus]AWC66172.1 hypothetical protein CG475_016760 [Bacillus cytotoxicus]
MGKPWYRRIYALYKGERFITEGTIAEIHAETNKSIDFLRYMTFPIYEKRCGNSTKRLRMVLIDD